MVAHGEHRRDQPDPGGCAGGQFFFWRGLWRRPRERRSSFDADGRRGICRVRFSLRSIRLKWWLFFRFHQRDSHQVLIRNLPAKMAVLAALLEALFEKNRAAGIGHEDSRSWKKRIAGAVLDFHPTPEK